MSSAVRAPIVAALLPSFLLAVGGGAAQAAAPSVSIVPENLGEDPLVDFNIECQPGDANGQLVLSGTSSGAAIASAP